MLSIAWAAPANSHFLTAEFRLLFPQLTGVLTLAFFIHNCVITIMKSNKNQENNVRLVHSDTVGETHSDLVALFYSVSQKCKFCWLAHLYGIFFAGAGPVCSLPPGRTDLPVRRSADLCRLSISSSLQRLHRTSETFYYIPCFLVHFCHFCFLHFKLPSFRQLMKIDNMAHFLQQ